MPEPVTILHLGNNARIIRIKSAEQFMRNRSRPHAVLRQGLLLLLPVLLALTLAKAESLSGQNLPTALRSGGYVILLRHASSPRSAPDALHANPDNVERELQLDEGGRSSARAMGEALHRLQIPIGIVLSSPTYRALETVKLAQLGKATTFAALGDGGRSMLAEKAGARGAWLRAKTAEPPDFGKNTVIVPRFPNITEAFPQDAVELADGEAVILRPDGRGAASLVARVKIDEWAALARTR